MSSTYTAKGIYHYHDILSAKGEYRWTEDWGRGMHLYFYPNGKPPGKRVGLIQARISINSQTVYVSRDRHAQDSDTNLLLLADRVFNKALERNKDNLI